MLAATPARLTMASTQEISAWPIFNKTQATLFGLAKARKLLTDKPLRVAG